ncbi:MAG: GyrI-like domain-containing protein [Microcoleaceae cyanobacterium]
MFPYPFFFGGSPNLFLRPDCGPIFNRLFDQVYDYVLKQGIQQVGMGLSMYHDTAVREHNIPVEALVTLPQELPSGEGIWVYELPGVKQAICTTHYGSFDNLEAAYNFIFDQLFAQGYKFIGSAREVYLEYDRQGDPAKYVTEIQIPVEKAGN